MNHAVPQQISASKEGHSHLSYLRSLVMCALSPAIHVHMCASRGWSSFTGLLLASVVVIAKSWAGLVLDFGARDPLREHCLAVGPDLWPLHHSTECVLDRLCQDVVLLGSLMVQRFFRGDLIAPWALSFLHLVQYLNCCLICHAAVVGQRQRQR